MKKTKVLINKLIEELEKTPLVQVACDKVGIARNTFYKWMKEDPEFLARVGEALSLGTGRVNDVATSNVLSGIQGKDAKYTMYWLNRKHPDFRQPFRYKIDADDLLEHDRAFREAEREIRLKKEIEEAIKKFQEKWFRNSEANVEKKAKKLFEEWKEKEQEKDKDPSI